MPDQIEIRPLLRGDKDQWTELFQRYRDFYALEPSREVVATVWRWISTEDHEVDALVAEMEGRLVGLAHYRRFSRPSTGSQAIWLDDLFTAPQTRGRGVARAIINRLAEIAETEERTLVRWLTAEDNKTAQYLYDDISVKTNWVVYDLKITS